MGRLASYCAEARDDLLGGCKAISMRADYSSLEHMNMFSVVRGSLGKTACSTHDSSRVPYQPIYSTPPTLQ